jgi:purine-binding chemotaxis protein CheW
MTSPAVMDDYLMDLLGDLGAAPPAPPAINEAAPATADVAAAAMAPSSQAVEESAFEQVAIDDAPDAVPVPAVAEAVEAPPVVPEPVPAAAAAPTLAVAPVRPGSEADLITDDEFEALLDQLHGGGAPTAPADTAPAKHAAAPAPAAVVPTAVPAAPAPAAVPAPRAVPPLPIKPYLQAPIDTGERRRATERKTRWLRLRCDQQHYALELLKVQEVVLPATLLPLRGAAHHMLGVMNLRGQVVPVIDMGLYLGRRPVETDANTRVVVLEENGETLGLRVTAVEDVANLTDQQIEPPDNARVGRMTNPLFRGVARLNERAVILLDASQLLT